jgi:hypothetical protein
MPIEPMARIARLLLPFVPVLLVIANSAGCASLQSTAQRPMAEGPSGLAPAAATAPRAAVAQSQAPLEPRYLRFRPDQTQLSNVQDDGRHTYLEFLSPGGADLEFFDQDGRPLESAIAGRVAAVQGLHAGILVRRADRASFVSQNPRTFALPPQPLVQSAEHAEARARLENQSDQLQAMQRALEAARLAVAAAAARRPAGRGGAATAPGEAAVQPPAPLQPSHSTSPLLPEVIYAAPPLSSRRLQDPAWPRADAGAPANEPVSSEVGRVRPLPQPVRHSGAEPRSYAPPLAAANASTFAPERGLIRVFFATASRAIVAPEDGLALLLREAGNADEVRVTGFTDATGSRASNDALALARADAVVQILLRRGIASGRIFSSAVGADEYIADNASERGRALNRRVEVLLLRNGEPMALGAWAAEGRPRVGN